MKGQTEGAMEFTGVGEWGEITEVWYVGRTLWKPWVLKVGLNQVE